MTITEKELAEKLADAYDDSAHGFRCMEDEADFLRVARKAAELLGVPLAPAKPEPGTWWIVADGPNAGKVARANGYEGLSLYGDEGQEWSYTDCDSWPALVPARVVPADPVELTKEEVGALWDEVNVSRKDWFGYTGVFHEQVTATVNAAITDALGTDHPAQSERH